MELVILSGMIFVILLILAKLFGTLINTGYVKSICIRFDIGINVSNDISTDMCTRALILKFILVLLMVLVLITICIEYEMHINHFSTDLGINI